MDRKLASSAPRRRFPRLRVVALEAMESRCPVSSMALSAFALPAVAAVSASATTRMSVDDRPGPRPAEVRLPRTAPPTPTVAVLASSEFRSRPAPVSVTPFDPVRRGRPDCRRPSVDARSSRIARLDPGFATAFGFLRLVGPGRERRGRGRARSSTAQTVATPRGQPIVSQPPIIAAAAPGQGGPSGSGGAAPAAAPVHTAASSHPASQGSGTPVAKPAATVALGQQPGAPDTTQFHGDSARTGFKPGRDVPDPVERGVQLRSGLGVAGAGLAPLRLAALPGQHQPSMAMATPPTTRGTASRAHRSRARRSGSSSRRPAAARSTRSRRRTPTACRGSPRARSSGRRTWEIRTAGSTATASASWARRSSTSRPAGSTSRGP